MRFWGSALFYCNADAWKALSPDIQAVVERNVGIDVLRIQQQDNTLANNALPDKLRRQGLTFNPVPHELFKARLGLLYAKCRALYGPALWALLEKYGVVPRQLRLRAQRYPLLNKERHEV